MKTIWTWTSSCCTVRITPTWLTGTHLITSVLTGWAGIWESCHRHLPLVWNLRFFPGREFHHICAILTVIIIMESKIVRLSCHFCYFFLRKCNGCNSASKFEDKNMKFCHPYYFHCDCNLQMFAVYYFCSDNVVNRESLQSLPFSQSWWN